MTGLWLALGLLGITYYPPAAAGAGDGDPKFTLVSATLVTGSLAAGTPGGEQVFEVSLAPSGRGRLRWLTIVRTAGDSTGVNVFLFRDVPDDPVDPSDGTPLIGTNFSSVSAATSVVGPYTDLMGVRAYFPVTVFNAAAGTSIYLAVRNNDGAEPGTYSVYYEIERFEAP